MKALRKTKWSETERYAAISVQVQRESTTCY